MPVEDVNMPTRKVTCRLACIMFVLMSVSGQSYAQYYEEAEYRSPARYLYGGVQNMNFQPRSSNPLSDSLTIEFDRIMPVIGFRQEMMDVTLGYTRFTTGGRSRTAIFFGAVLSTEVPLSGQAQRSLVLPVLISADYMKAEARGSEKDNFNIGSIGIGAGLRYRYSGTGVDFSVGAVEVVHLSSEGFGSGTGFSAATLGEANVMLRGALLLNGIVLGYRFRLQTWSMSDEAFDYRSFSHGPYLGIMF